MALKKWQEEELMVLADADIIEAARQKLLPFILHTKEDFEVGWHNQVLCAYLDLWVEKKIKRLLVFMPPRHGKSEAVSRRLPAFIFGKYPDAQIIATTYGADLSSGMNRDVQRVIDSPEYREIFPNTTLSGSNVKTTALGSWLRNSEEFEIVNHRGRYRCAGVGGSITGKGADYFIIDDPVKNAEEADSPTYRENAWDWYTSTAYTRLEKDACMLVTMTRWHEADLAGKLIDLMKTDPSAEQWVVLSLPAIFDDEKSRHKTDKRQIGEALWPWKYSANVLHRMKSTVGSRFWEAMFQQRPAPVEGGILKIEWLRQYYRTPPDHFDEQILSMDCTFKGNDTSDFTVIQAWGRLGANLYLLDQYRARVGFIDAKNALIQMSAKWPQAYTKIVEDKANGTAIIETLKNEIPGIIAYSPKESKISRANAASPAFEALNVWLPHPSIAPWVGDYVTELTTFPNAANDDQMDVTTQAILRFRGKISGDFTADMVTKSNQTIGSKRSRPTW